MWRKGGLRELGEEGSAAEGPAGEVKEAVASICIPPDPDREEGGGGEEGDRGLEGVVLRAARVWVGSATLSVLFVFFVGDESERRWIGRLSTAQMVTGVDPWEVESEFNDWFETCVPFKWSFEC